MFLQHLRGVPSTLCDLGTDMSTTARPSFPWAALAQQYPLWETVQHSDCCLCHWSFHSVLSGTGSFVCINLHVSTSFYRHKAEVEIRNKQALGQVTYSFSFEKFKILESRQKKVLAYTANFRTCHTGLHSSILMWANNKNKCLRVTDMKGELICILFLFEHCISLRSELCGV